MARNPRQLARHNKVHGDVVTVLRFIHQMVHLAGLVLKQLQEALVEKRGTHKHHRVPDGKVKC